MTEQRIQQLTEELVSKHFHFEENNQQGYHYGTVNTVRDRFLRAYDLTVIESEELATKLLFDELNELKKELGLE